MTMKTLTFCIITSVMLSSCNIFSTKTTEPIEAVKPENRWIFGKTFIQKGSENLSPELGGAAFVNFESKDKIELKTGDIVSRMKATFDGNKITLEDLAMKTTRTFTSVNNEYLLDESGLKWTKQ
jgi:hypothetical protein